MKPLRRLSTNTAAALIGAAAFAVLSTGTAVAVATSAVSITDASSGVKAHVTGKASLLTSERDPVSGVYAKTDASGRRLVGDGSGALTVDGSVLTRSAVPTTWNKFFSNGIENGNAGAILSATAPATGNLTLRTVNVQIAMPSGQRLQAYVNYTERDGTAEQVYITLVAQGADAYGRDIYVGSFDEDLYPKASSAINVIFLRNSSTDYAPLYAAVLGQMT
jgi:hypothetical protein